MPRYCLVCGSLVHGQEHNAHARGPGPIPLCGRCLSALPEITGERCRCCGRELLAERDLCYPCRNTPHECREIVPLFRYKGTISLLVRQYKSGKRFSLAPFWADRMAPIIGARWPGRTIVPVPPRQEKLAHHEWDQVEAIAGCLEKKGYPVARILRRTAALEQKRLSKDMRKTNALKGYSIAGNHALKAPRGVVLLDDVYTTGATVDACAKALMENGSEEIAAIVIAMD